MRVGKVLRFICYPMRVPPGTVSFKTDFGNFSIYSVILYRCVVAVVYAPTIQLVFNTDLWRIYRLFSKIYCTAAFCCNKLLALNLATQG